MHWPMLRHSSRLLPVLILALSALTVATGALTLQYVERRLVDE